MAQLNFDANSVNPNASMDPIPAGWYSAVIDESEMKPTKDGAGSYLQLRFNVIEGEFANRKVFARLNLRNSSQVAQEIAYGDLSAICHATGVMQIADSQQLHNIPMKIKVSLRGATDDYEASNELKGYKNINENVGNPTAGGAQQPTQQPVQQPVQQQTQQPAQQPWQQPAQEQPAQQPWQQPAQEQPAQQPAQEQPAQQQQQTQPAQQQQQTQPAPVQQAQQTQPAPVQQAQQEPVVQQNQQQPEQGQTMPSWAQGQS